MTDNPWEVPSDDDDLSAEATDTTVKENTDWEMPKDESDLLNKVVAHEMADVEAATEVVERAVAAADTKQNEPYPPTSLAPKDAAPVDAFAAPELTTSPADSADGSSELKTNLTSQPYEGTIPDTIITAQLQKAMLRARTVLSNSFKPVKMEASNLERVLIEEKPEIYVDAVIRLTAMHFICWQKAMGLH